MQLANFVKYINDKYVNNYDGNNNWSLLVVIHNGLFKDCLNFSIDMFLKICNLHQINEVLRFQK